MVTSPYQNADGLTVKFSNYYKDSGDFVNRPRAVSTMGVNKQIVIDYDLSKLAASATSYTSDLDNDGTLDGFNLGDTYLPAYASVKEVTLVVTEAAAGGTSITLGTYGLTGTAVSATSLITATEGVKANIDTKGARVYGAGALVSTTAETASVGTADAFIGLTVAGTFTAGKGQITIIYTAPVEDVV